MHYIRTGISIKSIILFVIGIVVIAAAIYSYVIFQEKNKQIREMEVVSSFIQAYGNQKVHKIGKIEDLQEAYWTDSENNLNMSIRVNGMWIIISRQKLPDNIPVP